MGWYDGDGGKPTPGGYFEAGGPKEFTWDTGAYKVPGMYEELIAKQNTVYPKLKHWYKGSFSGGLSGIDWLIKTMDKPKISVESMPQLRNNVARNYPIKYDFGDLSITLWDDIDHKAIKAVDSYFQGKVWSHGGDKKGAGDLMLRDSIVIPSFDITEYSTEGKPTVTFTYYNAVLSSFDYDATDDEGDESVYTIQVVFKIEGYSVA